MIRILDITTKDLLQLVRERSTFLFLLVMPLLFTLLIGFASGGIGKVNDARVLVGFQDEDGSRLSRQLKERLGDSKVIRLKVYSDLSQLELNHLVGDGKLAAAIFVPENYGHAFLSGKSARLVFFADTSSTAGQSVESELLSQITRLESAVRTGAILEELVGEKAPFAYTVEQVLEAWEDPPVRVNELVSPALQGLDSRSISLAHNSPGMMLQFAIASLLTSAQILVIERKSRALQRLLTTATHRLQIMLGHYLAIFIMILIQFSLLILFGNFVLRVHYLRQPLATGLLALSAAACIAALGLLIGVFARTQEQAIIFSLVPMFVLAGLGGAWVPLEATGPTFQIIGHFSPLAWAMDGFKNICLRGMGLEGVGLPVLALSGYAGLFLSLAAWKFHKLEG
jgi:ABC-2 type transport system permease protein